MEVIIKASRQGCPDSGHLLEVRDAGSHHSLQSTEVLQQLAALGGPQSRHHFEHRFVVATRAFTPMPGDGESMRFIPNALYET